MTPSDTLNPTSPRAPLTFKQWFATLGPGLIMASAAVGGSHIVASTQAGVQFGFQLGLFIIAVNILKYPFFRFAYQYALETGKSMLDGYAALGKPYVAVFLVFNLIATLINIAGASLLSAALLAPLLPFKLPLWVLTVAVVASYLLILFKKQYPMLDWFSKNIMLVLTVISVVALAMATYHANAHPPSAPVPTPSPWTVAAVPFLIVLMGWMPAPIEISVATSMWVVEKNHIRAQGEKNGLLDFNIGYVTTIVLALVFMALGALMRADGMPHGGGGAYVAQFVDMYAHAMGEWTRWFIALLAFVCIYGTTITAVDGYSRTNMRSVHLLTGRQKETERELFYWILVASLISLFIILFYQSSVKVMIPLAMTLSFISAPIFSWLNLSVFRQQNPSLGMRL